MSLSPVNLSPHNNNKRRMYLALKDKMFISWRHPRNKTSTAEPFSRSLGDLPDFRRVHFNELELVSIIPEEEDPITEIEIKESWYNHDDYTRFEKDRVLTSLGYITSRRNGGNGLFDESKNSCRGLESMCDPRLAKRQIGERKDLVRAMKQEEERQKKEDIFPDLEKFRTVSLRLTRSGRDRATTIAQEDAKLFRPKQQHHHFPLLVVDAITKASSNIRMHPRFRSRWNTVSPSELNKACPMERRNSIG